MGLRKQAHAIKGCPGVETCEEFSNGERTRVCCHKACESIRKPGFTYQKALRARKRGLGSCTVPSNNKPGNVVEYDADLWGMLPVNAKVATSSHQAVTP